METALAANQKATGPAAPSRETVAKVQPNANSTKGSDSSIKRLCHSKFTSVTEHGEHTLVSLVIALRHSSVIVSSRGPRAAIIGILRSAAVFRAWKNSIRHR